MSREPAIDVVPHTLEVIDGPEGDYEIHHPDSCPAEIIGDGVLGHPHYKEFRCRVEACREGNDIDDIEKWDLLPPGWYPIVSVYEYMPGEYGGSYGSESSIWLELRAPEGEEPWTCTGTPDYSGGNKATLNWKVTRAVAERVAAENAVHRSCDCDVCVALAAYVAVRDTANTGRQT